MINHNTLFNLVHTLFFLIFLSTPSQANTFDFFSHDWNTSNALIVFHYKAGDVQQINSALLAFFSVDDCQKDFLAHYKTTGEGAKAFLIKPSDKFALQSDKTYQIATAIIPFQKINQIHSLLISFQGKPRELPRFLGACADQGSKCCVAVQCSNEAGVCLLKYSVPSQSFILFSDYDLG